ncbi:MAG: carboxymuconolactone decarboxylase family protein [Minwuia sp.]|nr:carboxymuconolactone decarboxylase family protein [Minwuia sp.]
MARVKYLTKDDLAEADKSLLDRDINLFRALAHNPKAARAFSHLGRHIRFGSDLDGRLRELAILQVGYLARSPYEFSHHIKIGADFGVSDADIAAMIAETNGEETALEPLARLILRTAREMTLDGGASSRTFDELKQHFPEDMIIELFLAIAFYNGVVRMLASLEIDVEPEYQQYLDRFPFPTD